jgi:methionyl-tRNA synthetase
MTGQELLDEGVPRDLIRFYLASTSPEFQRTNFTRAAMAEVTSSRLVAPWNRIAAKVNALGSTPLPVSERSRVAARLMVERFAGAYDVRRFSVTAAAFTLTEQLARLDSFPLTAGNAGDFCHEVDTFLRCAGPILTDLAAKALGDTTIPSTFDAEEFTPRQLPELTE